MRTLGLIAVLAASAVMAANAVSVDTIEPPTEYNAKWYLFRSGEVRCDREGLNVYGSNDYAYILYMGLPINLCGYDGVLMRIVYMQEAADEGDYCQLYLGDDDMEYTLFHTFEDTDGTSSVILMLDDYYGTRDLKMYFLWVSDETGVDKGFRIFDIEINGVLWGEGEYTNVFTWTWGSPDDVTGHQTFDVSDIDGNMVCLAFEYGTEEDTQGWWAIDNVDVLTGGESVLPRQGGGYGVEDFSSGGWHQDRHGMPGEWEIDTDHATGDMSGENWQCDSGAHPASSYHAETFSPWFRIHPLLNSVICEFDTWFSPMDAGDYASFGLYTATGDLVWRERFLDLDDWYSQDSGDDVVETSWGAIKAGF